MTTTQKQVLKLVVAVALIAFPLLTYVTAAAVTVNAVGTAGQYPSYNYTKNYHPQYLLAGGYGGGNDTSSSPASASPSALAGQQQQLDSVQVLKDKPDKGDKGDKGGKPDKGDKGQKDKKPKKISNVKITADVDASQVANATDAAQAYSFTVTSGTFTSKPKTLESNEAEGAEALTLNFNGKLLVTTGDSFTVTGVSSTDAYNTVTATGTLTEQPQGKSGKTTIVGSLDSPLVLQETAIENLS